jgi:hypothetical protein
MKQVYIIPEYGNIHSQNIPFDTKEKQEIE